MKLLLVFGRHLQFLGGGITSEGGYGTVESLSWKTWAEPL